MKVEITLKGKQYYCPTSWHDVPFKTYLSVIDKENIFDIINGLTNIPTLDLMELDAASLSSITALFSFTNEPPNAYYKGDKHDIGKDTYGNIEMAKALIKKAEKPSDAIIDVLKVYTGVDYSEYPTDEANPIGAFFLLKSLNFSTNTSG